MYEGLQLWKGEEQEEPEEGIKAFTTQINIYSEFWELYIAIHLKKDKGQQ